MLSPYHSHGVFLFFMARMCSLGSAGRWAVWRVHRPADWGARRGGAGGNPARLASDSSGHQDQSLPAPEEDRARPPAGLPVQGQLYPRRCVSARPAGRGSPGTPPAGRRALTQAQQHGYTSARRPPGTGAARSGALQERPARSSRRPVHELAAERLGLGHQLLVGGRAVKGVHDLGGEDRGRRSTSMAGTRARTPRTCGRTALRRAHPVAPAGLRREGRPRGGRAVGRGEGARRARNTGRPGGAGLRGRAPAGCG